MKKLTLLLLLACGPAFAQDLKISQLTSGSPAQAADMIPIARAGANFRLAGSDFCLIGGCTMTAPILQAAGSSAAPSYSFSAETDMGCYRDGANQMTCSTGASGARGTLALGGNSALLAYNAGGTGTWFAANGTAQTLDLVAGGTVRWTTSTTANTSIGVPLYVGAATADQLRIVNLGAGAGAFSGTITSADLTAARTWTLPNVTGNFSLEFDPSTTVELIEEFPAGGSSSGSYGTNGLLGTLLASGTVNSAHGNTFVAGHPGTIRLLSHATNDDSGVNLLFTSGGASGYAGWTTLDWTFIAIVNPVTVATSALYVGLIATDTGVPGTHARGVWIRRDTDRSDTNFVFQTCDSATNGCGSAGDDTNSKVSASTITPTDDLWYLFKIRHAVSGVGGNPTIYMSVNGETEKTFCSAGCDDVYTEVSTSLMIPAVSWVTRTTTGVVSSYVDLMYLKWTGLTRY